MKTVKVVVLGAFVVVVGLCIILYMDRQVAYSQINQKNEEIIAIAKHIDEGKAKSYNDKKLAEAMLLIDLKKADMAILQKQLEAEEKALGVLYQSLPILKKIILEEVTKKNNITQGL